MTDTTVTGSIAAAAEAVSKIGAEAALASRNSAHKDLADDIHAGINSLIPAAKSAAEFATATLADKQMYPEGRQEKARGTIEQTDAAITETSRILKMQARTLSLILAADALDEPKGEANARIKGDVEAALRLAPDPAATLRALATDVNVDVAALVAGPWGQRLASSLGMSQEDVDGIRKKALDHLETKGGKRGEAARAARLVGGLPSAIGATEGLARSALNSGAWNK
jgi:hypothetical protein